MTEDGELERSKLAADQRSGHGVLNASHSPPRGGVSELAYSEAAKPASEAKRLNALSSYRILDTTAEQSFDDLTRLASTICSAPIALVSFIDRERQWFKSRFGLDVASTPREISFCAHAILHPDKLFIVPDTAADVRFAGNPLVLGSPNIRFYAGAPLVTREGDALGTICVIDRQPRTLTEEQKTALQCLARQVVLQLELRDTVAHLEERTLTDSLTGAWNRLAFNLRFGEEWKRHLRGGRSVTLLMVDVDNFKVINDEFGHGEGDRALVRSVKLLSAVLRQSDFLARYGGEEFAIILPETEAGVAGLIAERVRKTISEAGWESRPVTVSVGSASMLPTPDLNRDLLVARADHALYQAKRSGRNRVEVFGA